VSRIRIFGKIEKLDYYSVELISSLDGSSIWHKFMKNSSDSSSCPQKPANENRLEKIQAKMIKDSMNLLDLLHFSCFINVTT
jgi:hypothetical protein